MQNSPHFSVYLVVVYARVVAHAAYRRQLNHGVVVSTFHHFTIQKSNSHISSSPYRSAKMLQSSNGIISALHCKLKRQTPDSISL